MVGLLVECGDAREVHHMALLIGYGAGAINPYLAFESIEDLIAEGHARPRRHRPAQGGAQLHQGVRQGRAQGDVEDGRVDGGQLHRAPRSSRRSASASELVDAVLHRHGQPARRHRARRDRRRGRRPPRRRPPDPARGAGPPQARARRRVPVAPRGRDPPVQPGDGVQAAARHAGQALRHLPEYSRLVDDQSDAAGHAARPVRVQGRRPPAGADRRGRAGRRRSCGASRPAR